MLNKLMYNLEIQEVLARYARGIDRLDGPMIRSCYHDGAVDHHGIFDGTADEFVPWVLDHLQRYTLSMHFLGQSLIEYPHPGADTAAVETYAMAFHRAADGEQRDNWITGFRYLDRFERRPVGDAGEPAWRIADRTVVGEWIRIDPLAEHRGFGDMPTGRRDASDAVYSLLGTRSSSS